MKKYTEKCKFQGVVISTAHKTSLGSLSECKVKKFLSFEGARNLECREHEIKILQHVPPKHRTTFHAPNHIPEEHSLSHLCL